MILSVAVVLGLITYSYASICCFPNQYEAFIGTMKSSVKQGKFSLRYSTIRFVFDGTAKKSYAEESAVDDGSISFVKVIEDLSARKRYTIAGTLCIPETITEFDRTCVPDNATLLTEATFGANTLNANVYNVSSASESSFLLTQQNNCYPILDVSSTFGLDPSMEVVVFMNITTGITDSSLLTVPDICKPSNPPVGK